MPEAAHRIRLVDAAVAHDHREKRLSVQQRGRHREVLSLTQRPRRRQNARNVSRRVSQKPVALAKPLAQFANRGDPHPFERSIEKQRAVEPGCVMARFGENILLPKHHPRREHLGLTREPTCVPRRLRGRHLQRQESQRIRQEKSLKNRRGIPWLTNRRLALPDRRHRAVFFQQVVRLRIMFDAVSKIGCVELISRSLRHARLRGKSEGKLNSPLRQPAGLFFCSSLGKYSAAHTCSVQNRAAIADVWHKTAMTEAQFWLTQYAF